MRVSDSAVFMFFWSAALPLLASLGLAGGFCHCRCLCWSFLLEISWFGHGVGGVCVLVESVLICGGFAC